MNRITVELRLDGKLDTTDEIKNRDTVMVRSLLDKMRINVVNYINHNEKGTTIEVDDSNEQRTIYNDETVVYVVIDVQPDNESFFENGYNLLKYIADALNFRPSSITDYHEHQNGKFTTSTVSITVGNIIDGIKTI